MNRRICNKRRLELLFVGLLNYGQRLKTLSYKMGD